ncbi:hypothetical protein L6164_001321 [Bauhinia variegata]|uniref:Uncharacterized protein n=1 Tax=Bauhinia variegata TaxID=167791 RepID=A0ACB9QAK0_BAUVA|nr:hypothetical protein L6164_001321 [Bauhinia variegata]
MKEMPMFDRMHEISSYFHELRPVVPWCCIVWNTYCISKMSCIAWLVFLDRLAIRSRLKRMNLLQDDSCVFCHNRSETRDRLFFECRLSSSIVKALMAAVDFDIGSDVFTTRQHVFVGAKRKEIPIFKLRVAAGLCSHLYLLEG